MATRFKSPAETAAELITMLRAFGIELNAGQKAEVSELIKDRMEAYGQANCELALAVHGAVLKGANARQLCGLTS